MTNRWSAVLADSPGATTGDSEAQFSLGSRASRLIELEGPTPVATVPGSLHDTRDCLVWVMQSVRKRACARSLQGLAHTHIAVKKGWEVTDMVNLQVEFLAWPVQVGCGLPFGGMRVAYNTGDQPNWKVFRLASRRFCCKNSNVDQPRRSWREGWTLSRNRSGCFSWRRDTAPQDCAGSPTH